MKVETNNPINWRTTDEVPPIAKDILFIYREQIHIGNLLPIAHSRPIKWVWECFCCSDKGIYNMEELEYNEKDAQPVKYWVEIKLPSDAY